MFMVMKTILKLKKCPKFSQINLISIFFKRSGTPLIIFLIARPLYLLAFILYIFQINNGILKVNKVNPKNVLFLALGIPIFLEIFLIIYVGFLYGKIKNAFIESRNVNLERIQVIPVRNFSRHRERLHSC